ncbi:MAG: hydrogen gas-evolving membrane-bound hydrogenase subunit E [Rickettsiaceae bacterium]|nr:hydrogen gas-evolving membrane-bound hydrogenase subunit E [Rickettsiaceae bacterium]
MISSYSSIFLIYLLSISAAVICASMFLARTRINKILILSSYSSVMCLLYLMLDASDVALTESAINASISTIFLILLVKKIGVEDPSSYSINYFTGICCFLGVLLICYDLSNIAPEIGNANSPLNKGLSAYYIKNTYHEIEIPAIVTAVLADYRGFDTFCETLVIFIAAIGVYTISGIKNAAK